MNKTILKLAYCAATVSLFTACASDDSFSESEAQNYVERAMKEDIASPIALGGATKSTITMESKSVLDSDPATQFFQTDGTNQWFGLFMVATSQIPLADGSSNYLTIDWSKNPVTVNGVERTNTWSVYTGDPDNASQGIDNLKTGARFINADGQRVSTLAEAAATRLYWSDAVERYYPIGNYHKYSFYGYYPYNSKQGAVKYTDKEIYVDFDYLDGTQDVIWGAARPTVEGVDIPDSLMYLAYSAKFFRYKANRDATCNALQAQDDDADIPDYSRRYAARQRSGPAELQSCIRNAGQRHQHHQRSLKDSSLYRYRQGPCRHGSPQVNALFRRRRLFH